MDRARALRHELKASKPVKARKEDEAKPVAKIGLA